MPSVKPREWDAMSAKEQLWWYLERLCAQADEMCSALGIARVGDPPVVTSLVDLAVSTTMHASPAPVPDVPSSTTKSTEVLEVICDASTACIVRAPINCSVDGSTQVSTVVSLNEIQDATTTVHPKPMVDLIHQEVAAEIVTLVPTTTNVSPKTSVQERDDSPLPSIHTSNQIASEADHSAVLIVPSNLVAPEPAKCSAECPVHVEQQPWPSPVQVKIRHRGHVFRPRPWPSFKYHSGAGCCEEACSERLGKTVVMTKSGNGSYNVQPIVLTEH